MAYKAFKDIPVGWPFVNNGTLWVKRSTRTAMGQAGGVEGRWFYFRNNEQCKTTQSPASAFGDAIIK